MILLVPVSFGTLVEQKKGMQQRKGPGLSRMENVSLFLWEESNLEIFSKILRNQF